MRKLFVIFILLVLSPVRAPALDIPLIDMTEDTSPGMDSLFYSLDDPAGTPVDRKVTLQKIADAIHADLEAADIPDLSATYQPLDALLTSLSGLSDPNADRIVFWDDSAGGFAWMGPGDGMAISGQVIKLDIPGLSAEAAPDSASDYAVIYDASAGAHRKVLLSNWPGVSGAPWCRTYALIDPDATDDGLWFYTPQAMTVTQVVAIVDPADTGESVVIDVLECDSNGDNCASILSSAITAGNTTTTGTLSDTSLASGVWIRVDIGTITGTVSRVTLTMKGNY
jgi:hypothetical protein